MTPDEAQPSGRAKTRTEAQKTRRKELWLARADDRRGLEERALRTRYLELKTAMARVGVRIGTIGDLAEHADPIKRYEVLKARLERWEALWMVTLRKRMTRGKIIIGGAVLAEIEDLDLELAGHRVFLDALVALIDARVPRVRDRLVVRDLLSGARGAQVALPLRQGGPADEPIEAALAAIGETLSAFERGVVGGGEEDADVADVTNGQERGEPQNRRQARS